MFNCQFETSILNVENGDDCNSSFVSKSDLYAMRKDEVVKLFCYGCAAQLCFAGWSFEDGEQSRLEHRHGKIDAVEPFKEEKEGEPDDIVTKPVSAALSTPEILAEESDSEEHYEAAVDALDDWHELNSIVESFRLDFDLIDADFGMVSLMEQMEAWSAVTYDKQMLKSVRMDYLKKLKRLGR